MEHKIAGLIREAIVSGLRQRTLSTCSRWTQACVVMPKPFDGPFSFKHHPWTREMHDSVAPVNVGQKSAQMGYTTVVIHRTFYKIDQERVNSLYLLPTKMPDATDFSINRFDKALELSPYLTKLFSSTKNVSTKRAGSATLYIRGMNSRSGLKSIDVSFIVFDELDEMPADKIPLAEERMSGQTVKQQWKISTPTIPEFGINKAFLESTQEHFMFPCPHCGRQTELTWPDSFKVCGDSIDDPDLDRSHCLCKECKHPFAHDIPISGKPYCDEKKLELFNKAIWVPTAEHPNWDIRGFYTNQMYSSTISPKEFAKAYIRSLSDEAADQEFSNSKLGVPKIIAGGRIDDQMIDDAMKRGDYRKTDPKARGKLITMGVDIGSWLHCCIGEWTFERFSNDLNVMANCKLLCELKVQSFDELDALMREWQIYMCVLDANPERRKVAEFIQRFRGHAFMCFYGKGIASKSIQVNKDEFKVTVDRTSWLDTSLGRFKNGTIKLPRDVSYEFRQHTKAVIRRYKKDTTGNPVGEYVNVGADHFAHATNYMEIALPLAASIKTNSNVEKFL